MKGTCASRFALGVGFALAATALVGAARPNPRDLPALVERWRDGGSFEAIALDGAEIFLAGEDGVAAFDAATGRRLWSRPPAGSACCSVALGVDGDALVAVRGAEVTILDRRDGRVLTTLALPGPVVRLAGPPFVAALSLERERGALVAIDAARGALSRVEEFPDFVHEIEVEGDSVVVAFADESRGVGRVEGFDARTLDRRFGVDGYRYASFVRVGGALHVSTGIDPAADDAIFRELDALTGELGAALPSRPKSRWHSSEFPWEYWYDEAADGRVEDRDEEEGESERFVLSRLDVKSGRALWSVELPGHPMAPLDVGARVLVPLRRGGGRLYLAVLDARSGAVRQLAFGLPADLDAWRLSGSDLVALGDSGLRAFDLARFGAAESVTTTIAERVAATLLETTGDDSIYGRGDHLAARYDELMLLGPEACPHVAALVPRLGATSLAAAALFVERQPCREAGAPLAARLGARTDRWDDDGWPGWKPQIASLRALAAVGDDAAVPPIAALLADAAAPSELRREAFLALAAIGTPGSLREIERFLAEPPPPRARFEPPAPPAGAASGGGWLAYASGAIGGARDLWIARTPAEGAMEPPLFTGVRLGDDWQQAELAIEPAEGGLTLRDASSRQSVTVRFDALRLDRDGDGLTDLVERRLRLDPARSDTDGDGLADSEDPAPNARLARPASVEQEIELALFEQYFRFESPEGGSSRLLIVSSSSALEWRGNGGLTVTLDPDDSRRFRDEAGFNGVATLTLSPWLNSSQEADEEELEGVSMACPLAAPEERRYRLSFYSGPLSAAWYCAVMRPLAGRWLLRRLELVGVS